MSKRAAEAPLHPSKRPRLAKGASVLKLYDYGTKTPKATPLVLCAWTGRLVGGGITIATGHTFSTAACALAFLKRFPEADPEMLTALRRAGITAAKPQSFLKRFGGALPDDDWAKITLEHKNLGPSSLYARAAASLAAKERTYQGALWRLDPGPGSELFEARQSQNAMADGFQVTSDIRLMAPTMEKGMARLPLGKIETTVYDWGIVFHPPPPPGARLNTDVFGLLDVDINAEDRDSYRGRFYVLLYRDLETARAKHQFIERQQRLGKTRNAALWRKPKEKAFLSPAEARALRAKLAADRNSRPAASSTVTQPESSGAVPPSQQP